MLKHVCTTLILSAVLLCASPAFAQSQSWNKVFNGEGRFAVLNQFNDEAVLDRETGLVWLRTPDPEQHYVWLGAFQRCMALNAGNRRGWRLPTIQELYSLMDSSELNPTLTPGHPFINVVVDGFYWSSSSKPGNPDLGYVVSFAGGSFGFMDRCLRLGWPILEDPPYAWCVRGGSGPESQ
jgi:Protein of unknown function (DUF1566)